VTGIEETSDGDPARVYVEYKGFGVSATLDVVDPVTGILAKFQIDAPDA